MRLPPLALRAGRPAPRGAHTLLRHRAPLLAASYRNLSYTARRRDEERKWSTPLAKQLADAIEATEPMPLARYMRMCLTSDLGGYYTRGDLKEGHDQFGLKGDFITSP